MQVQMAEKLTVILMDDPSESVAEFLSLDSTHLASNLDESKPKFASTIAL